MFDRRAKGVCFIMAAAGVLLVGAAARACNVPVFRYALERWPAAPYEVWVFHRGPLPEAETALVAWLREAGQSEYGPPAFLVETVDLAGEVGDEAAEVWAAAGGEAGPPWMVVWYPRSFGIEGAAWSAPLETASAHALVRSPAREELARRVLGGESGVFVLLECGDAAKDDAAARLVEEELAKLEKLLRLPELVDGLWNDPIYDAQGAPELRLDFSVLRVSRTDPAERALVSMLLGMEEDLRTLEGPMVFPVYGRGRVLWALVGEGINAENLLEAGAFFVGPCSCTVKEQNPGTDLLAVVEWDAALTGEASAIPEVEPPPLTGLAKFAQAAGTEPDPAEAAGAGTQAAEAPPGGAFVGGVAARLGPAFTAAVAGVAALAIVAVVSVVVWKRGKRAEA